jgi:hypothetical protein
MAMGFLCWKRVHISGGGAGVIETDLFYLDIKAHCHSEFRITHHPLLMFLFNISCKGTCHLYAV